jgi:excisionase family DNA binding protein
MKDGYGKIPAGAKYAGISSRTFRELLKQGLRHIRLPSGTVLVKYSDIDAFLEQFAVTESEADRKVDAILKDF